MSIIIKGMKMPKDGRLLISIHPDGCVYRSVYDMGFEKVDCAKAKELPLHGDLIDAEEEMRLMQSSDYDTYDDYSRAFDMLDNAPIVIEEEAEE